MKKLITLLTLLLCAVGSTWAEEAVLSWYMGTNGAAASSANSITGASGCAAEGFTIAITGNASKNWSNGNGDITYKGTVYKTLKNSNGAQNTITCPTGYVATNVVFYVTTNADSSGKLSEIDGTSCDDVVSSIKDYGTPTIISKAIDNKSSFTFTFSTKQVCFLAVVTYQTPKPTINTQPISAAYQKDAVATALSVTAIASAGDLSYQWYSCDDAVKTNPVPISGETGASYTPATSATGTFYYFCRVTDANGSTDSNVATITVSNAYAPIVTPIASSLEVLQYEDGTLGVTIDAIPAATVQWYSCDDALKTNPVAIVGATSATYSPSTSTTGTYYFYAVATNAVGSTASDVITLTVNADITGETFYSWNQGTESGGTAVASDGESVNCPNSDYSTIRLNGKSDFTTNVVTITLTNALKAGDKIKVTGYRNKNDNNKQAGFKAKFENGAATVGSSTGLEFVNIDTSDASAGDSNRGTEPNTCIFTVPASAAGSKTITMTRSHTSTNLFISKLEIYRPAISLDAVLNAAGLLTAAEVEGQATFNFGVTSANERVAADAGNAVTVISGKYHNDHGCTSLNVVANVPGKVKITIGQCTFSTNTITVKNSSDVVVATLTPNSPACWKNDKTKVDVLYYYGDATTLTISGMSYCPYIAIEEIDEAPAIGGTITASGYNTFSSYYPLDLSTISGGTAYVASSVTDGKVVLTKCTDKVAAGTGLMIAGTADADFTINTTADAATFAGDNLFVGMPNGGEVEVAGEGYNYVFGWTEEANPGFYKVVSDVPTLEAGKAYLHTTAVLGAPSARLALSFEDEETTGIENLTPALSQGEGAFYDLQGRRVAAPQKGLYIVNGKKVIVK